VVGLLLALNPNGSFWRITELGDICRWPTPARCSGQTGTVSRHHQHPHPHPRLLFSLQLLGTSASGRVPCSHTLNRNIHPITKMRECVFHLLKLRLVRKTQQPIYLRRVHAKQTDQIRLAQMRRQHSVI
jgi:hypothetical protein